MGKNHTDPSPPYRRLKRKDRRHDMAYVDLDGRRVYLGRYDSPESWEAYHRALAERSAAGNQRLKRRSDMTVVELCAAYVTWASGYHQDNGRPTREFKHIQIIVGHLDRLYGSTPAVEFGPLALKALREDWISAGLSRTYINDQAGRVKRIFAWAVENELVPAEVWHALKAVAGLKRRRSKAREGKTVRPVSDAHVNKIQPYVSRQIWAMIQLQRLSGYRPGETVIMRACDIDMDGDIWLYRPREHKGEHLDRDRVVPLGPRSQAVVSEFLKADTRAYLFSPAEAEVERRARMRERRRTKVQPSQQDRSKLQAWVKPGERYTVDSYRRAIARACKLAFPAPDHIVQEPDDDKRKALLTDWHKQHRWHPHQLRHSAGTAVRKDFGLEAAQVHLGHASADVTQIYAERNLALAVEIARKIG